MTLIHLCIISLYLFSSTSCMSKNEKAELRETVKDMFQHAYNSYMTHAYPADELMPLTCKGRYRDIEPSRGDVDDILGNFSMTLIDSLDSLAIFGEIEEFEHGVKLVIENVQFDNDVVVSVFETNIRVVGGLLGAHVAAGVFKRAGNGMAWYNDELLKMAKDMGERLLPAFNTTTGIPYPRVNLKYGVFDPRSRTGTESDTCTACAGTMIMEFGALSRLTGVPMFEAAAAKAMKALWTYRSRTSDLVGTVINIHSGEWVRRDSGVGAGIDSYYEYCLKAYILLGEGDYLHRFNQHYKAVMRYINKDSLFLNVHMHNPTKLSYSYMDSLQAFWPGLQVLKGDLKAAIELHEVFYSVAKRHTFLPEAFTTNFEVHWGQHLLRPELVESTYFLYEATKDPYYLEVGKYIVENLNKYTRVPCGFAAVRDVRTLSHEDRMDSFLLSETLKYLYLLFTDKEALVIDIHDFVFTTEAHILPLGLSNWNGTSTQNNIYQSEHLHDHSCPSTLRNGNMMSFAEEIRRNSRAKSKVSRKCAKQTNNEATTIKTTFPPPLRAEQFIPGNIEHLQILKSMGISVTKTDDGKVQLMQNAAVADTSDMATAGIMFMQSMMELAKSSSDDGAPEKLPRVVQILSPPYNGNIVLNAGPAQFGIDLGTSEMGISAEVILAEPLKGCTASTNKDLADHRIVVLERGDCMFIDKVRQAESYGAVGVIIIDNYTGSSSESQPMFAMSGDGSNDGVNIPAVFLFSNEGDILKKAMQIVTRNAGGNLRVRVAHKALKQVSKTDKSSSTSEDPSTQSAESSNEQQETPKSESSLVDEKSEEQTKSDKPATEQLETSGKGFEQVNKLLELMQNVANQHGFAYLADDKRIKNKAVLEGKWTSEGDAVGWLDSMVAKIRVEESHTDGLLRQKAAEKADLDAIGKNIREKNDGKTGGVCGSTAGMFQSTRADFEDISELFTSGSEISVIGNVKDEKQEHIVEDRSTTEPVSSVINEGDSKVHDNLLPVKKTEMEEDVSSVTNEEDNKVHDNLLPVKQTEMEEDVSSVTNEEDSKVHDNLLPVKQTEMEEDASFVTNEEDSKRDDQSHAKETEMEQDVSSVTLLPVKQTEMEEDVSFVTNEMDSKVHDNLLPEDVIGDGTHAENKRITETPSDVELNSKGYSDSQNENIEDLHPEIAEKVVTAVTSDEKLNMDDLHSENKEKVSTGTPSDEILNTEHYSDSQNDNSQDLHPESAEKDVTDLPSDKELNTEGYSELQNENIADLQRDRLSEDVTGVPSDEELNTENCPDSKKENLNTVCSSVHEPRTGVSDQSNQEIETRANFNEGGIDEKVGVSEVRDNIDAAGNPHVAGNLHVNTLNELRAETAGSSPQDSSPGVEEELTSVEH